MGHFERSANAGPFRAFSQPSYRWIWTGSFVSNIGTWMERVAVGIYVTEVTHQAGWTATIAALLYLPAALFSPLGGALADRLERRGYLTWGTLSLTILATILTALSATGHLSVFPLIWLMGFTGIATSLMTPAFNAFLYNVVPTAELTSAVFLNSGQWNLARIVGPMLAALIIEVGGVTWAFAFNAASFLAVLYALRRTPSQHPRRQEAETAIWVGVRQGIDLVRTDKALSTVLILTSLMTVGIAPFIGLIPAFAIVTLGSGAAGTSTLVACQGLGAVLAAIVSSTWADHFGRGRWLQAAAFVLAPVAIGYWLSPSLPWAMIGIFLLGATYLAGITASSAICFGRAPSHLQARVSSLFSVVVDVGYGAGLMLQGWLGDQFGTRWVAVGGCLAFAAGVLTLKIQRPDIFSSLDQPNGDQKPNPVLSTE